MNDALGQLATLAIASAGLDLSAIPRHSLVKALQSRLRATRHTGTSSYARFLEESADERAEFLEEVLVPESFFFRDAGAFAEMQRWCQQWYRGNTGVLRILSAPCSTGEEPYSLAAMLWEKSIDPELFLVQAADISGRSLATARAATYGSLSLRGLPAGQTPAFLDRTQHGWVVREPVRRRVRFQQVNLVGANPGGASDLAKGGLYHLICSRNVMLYQTAAARARLALTLKELLAPGGRLVIGAADWCPQLAEHFTFDGPAGSFALRVRRLHAEVSSAAAVPTPASTADAARTGKGGAESLPQLPGAPAIKARRRPGPALASTGVLAGFADLSSESARQLHAQSLAALSEGQLVDAERLCRQALYLDSAHLPSLELLSRLWAPAGPERMRRALAARLARHRGASSSQEDASRAR